MDYETRRNKPPQECEDNVCKKIISQKADVNVPVEIKPTAEVGKIESECCGEPRIINDECEDSCKITIVQTIRIKIPIKYNVSTNIGKSLVVCHANLLSPH